MARTLAQPALTPAFTTFFALRAWTEMPCSSSYLSRVPYGLFFRTSSMRNCDHGHDIRSELHVRTNGDGQLTELLLATPHETSWHSVRLHSNEEVSVCPSGRLSSRCRQRRRRRARRRCRPRRSRRSLQHAGLLAPSGLGSSARRHLPMSRSSRRARWPEKGSLRPLRIAAQSFLSTYSVATPARLRQGRLRRRLRNLPPSVALEMVIIIQSAFSCQGFVDLGAFVFAFLEPFLLRFFTKIHERVARERLRAVE